MACPLTASGGAENVAVWCNGHGMCKNAATIAAQDYNNSYATWDGQVRKSAPPFHRPSITSPGLSPVAGLCP
jgi:hypothetical protein